MKSITAVLLVAVASATAEVVTFRRCDNSISPLEACAISELRIDPCSTKNDACRLKKGKNAALSLDFTPNFSATSVKTAVFYPNNNREIPFESVGTVDACPYTTCPFVPGTANTFTFDLYLGKKLPKGTFPLRWKIWNVENEGQMCCFETTVALR